jgi:nitric oxide reductase activation protein
VPCSACGYTDLPVGFDAFGRSVWSGNDLVRDYPVRVEIYKEFEETYTAEVMNRIRPPVTSNNTPEFDCIREYALPALMARREERKILFIICDGEPNCQSYGLNQRMKVTYNRYIRAMKDEGIKVFGFGIGADLSQYFEDDWMMVNGNAADLGKSLIDKLTVILNRKE